MKIRHITISFIFVLGLLLSNAPAVSAEGAPSLPSSFYGTVKLDGANVPVGTVVQAFNGDQLIAQGYTQMYLEDSVYSLDVPGDDTDTAVIDGCIEDDTITFKVDGTFANETGTWHSGTNVQLDLTVHPNSAPVANAQSVTTNEDTALAITLTGSDADNDPLTFAIVKSPSHGTLTGVAPKVTYTPAAGYSGSDSFTFKVNDGTVDSAPATVSITVLKVNSAPVANAQSVTTDEDTALAITLTGSDADGDPLTFSIVKKPSHGTLTGVAPKITYTPAADYNGSDSFTFRVYDGTVYSAPATVSISIAPVADSGTITLRSAGSLDGWILESKETSGKGSKVSASGSTFNLGDDARDRQYRAILSFNTAKIPDDAVITKVTLKIKYQGKVGTNPFTTHGNLLVDIKKGAFSGKKALEAGDFSASASKGTAGKIKNSSSGGWYSASFGSSRFSYINKTGITQFRLRFSKDDNDDKSADYLKFYSGNYSNSSYRPVLVIEYIIP